MGRSIAAVVVGFLGWTVLWLTGNATLSAVFASRYRPDGSTGDSGLLLLILGFSVVCSVFAGWLTARVAARSPMGHALVLGVVQLAVGVVVQLQYWDLMPLWYHLGFLALLLPGTLLGGRWRVRQIA